MVRLSIILFICVFLLSAVCGSVYSEENYPQRIISLGPVITKELYILKMEDKLVGCTVYCQSPPEAKMKEKIGTMIEVNIEKIVTLKPDLVLATSLTTPETKEKLQNLGIKVITFLKAKNFKEICEHFLVLGRMVGKEKEAEKIVRIVGNRIDLIKNKTKDLKKPKVFIQIGAKPLVTVTRDSFINDFIEFAGGINITKSININRYSREKVLRDNPDIIIIVTMGINGEEEKRIWQRFKTLKAVKNDKIYIIHPNKITSPTPLIFAKTQEEIAEILHPHLEEKR